MITENQKFKSTQDKLEFTELREVWPTDDQIIRQKLRQHTDNPRQAYPDMQSPIVLDTKDAAEAIEGDKCTRG